MDREKLLLMKEIIKYAEENCIHFTGDIISKLNNEEKEILELLAWDTSYWKKAYCRFILEKEMDSVVKKQILKELTGRKLIVFEEMSMDSYQKYMFSLADYYQLVNSETELSHFMEEVNKSRAQHYVTDFIASLSMLEEYGMTPAECLAFMDTIYKRGIYLIPDITKIINGYYKWLKENRISYQEVLDNLDIVLKSSPNLTRHMLDCLKFSVGCPPLDITNEEMKTLLQEMNEHPNSIYKIRNLMKKPEFIQAINNKKIEISKFLDYIHGQDSRLSLVVFSSLLSHQCNHLQKGEEVDNLFKISQELTEILDAKDTQNQIKYVEFMESENVQDLMNKDPEGITNLIRYLTTLPESRAYPLMSALEDGTLIKIKKDSQEIIDYIKQFEQLNENTLLKFVSYMHNPQQECPERLFATLSYLIEKISCQPTPLEQNKIETSLDTINPVIYRTKTKKKDTINKQVIDIIFDTNENEQLETIREVAEEFYPTDLKPSTYLLMIWYMSKYKLRDKAETSCWFYRDEIVKINEMLEKIDQEEEKVKKKV